MTKQEEVIAYLKSLNIHTRDDSYDVRERMSDREDAMTQQIRVTDGASKICMVFTKEPFVVKWCARDMDEAKKEVEVYQRATEQNLAKFFPKTALLANINGIDFVIQEKIDFSASDCDRKNMMKFRRISKTAKDNTVEKIEREFAKAASSYRRSLDSNWAKMAIVIYGKKACKSLCKFIIENKINDLHGSNLGYKNGKPMILDFSGYFR